MIEVSPLQDSELAEVAALFNLANQDLPYFWPLAADDFRALVLLNQGEPDAVLSADPEGWLVARLDGKAVGFVHCNIGRLATEDRAERRGFIRMVAMAPDHETAVHEPLLAAAEMHFRTRNVSHVTAFDVHTGYACPLAGRGMLAGHHFPVMTSLDRAGFKINERWLLYERVFDEGPIEYVPQWTDLRLTVADRSAQGFSIFLSQRAEPLAELKVLFLDELSRHGDRPSASLRNLHVAADYRRKGLGSWLMQRAANDMLARGYPRLIVSINHLDAPAQGLLISLGFEELPLSGYSFVKQLR
ncbi:MAG: GNAT family N-acetyltransferase [Caldilineales bacterium]|nr:GNAT family N-acetyltransferase [Caldilineales bacterium]